MYDYFSNYQKQPWFILETTPRSSDAKRALGQKLMDAADHPVIPGTTYEYLDDTVPGDMTLEVIEKNHLNGYLYSNIQRDKNQKKIFMYIHGGGFVAGNGYYARFAGIHLCQNLELPVFSVEYTLAQDQKLPQAAKDVYFWYHYLTEEKHYDPANIILGGDSAGGSLALSLIMRLIEEEKKLPAKLIPLHPTVDVRNSPTDIQEGLISHRENTMSDPIFLGGLPSISNEFVKKEDMINPQVSPIYFSGDYSKFPPTYIVADEGEILLSDALIIAEKLASANIDVTMHVHHQLWHCFQIFFPDIPESQLLFKKLRAFIKK